MNRFSKDMRVKFLAGHPCVGKTGVVTRVLIRNDREAWIATDEPLSPDLRSFPEGDPRANHICAWIDEVEAIPCSS